MTSRQKMTYGFVGVLLAATAALSIWWNLPVQQAVADSATSSREDRKVVNLTVAVRPAQVVDHITRTRMYTGELRAARKSQLSFEIAGRLQEVLVDEGDSVEAGQLLARLDVLRNRARLKASKATLKQAQAVEAELQAGPREQTIASSKAEVVSLDADVARLQLDFRRSEKLVATKAISQERFDTVRFQLQALQAKREAAQKKLDELLAGVRREKLDAQAASIGRLEAEVEALRLEVEDGELRAPFAGRISARTLDEGTVVSPGMQVFEILEDQKLEAWFGIPPTVANEFQGKSQGRESQDPANAYRAKVGEIEFDLTLRTLRPSLDPQTLTQDAVFELSDAAQEKFVDGQMVRLLLPQEIQSSGILLPTSSLVPGTRGLWAAYVAVPVKPATNNSEETYRVEQRDVTLLDAMGDTSLVSGTLLAGELVIVDGAHRVVVGQRIDVSRADGSR